METMEWGEPRGSILKPAEKAEFLGARNGVGWQGAERYSVPGLGVNILLD